MPRRTTIKRSRQLTRHIEVLANFFKDVHPELSMDDAVMLASNLVTEPPDEVIAAMRSMVWLQRPRRVLHVDDKRHGTLAGYNHFGCRCDKCKEANVADGMRRRKAREAKGLPADDERHGTYNAYINYGCRCDHCKLAARDRYVKH